MNVTLYSPMTQPEADRWHRILSTACGVHMQLDPAKNEKGEHHTFFTLLDPDEQAIASLRGTGDLPSGTEVPPSEHRNGSVT